MRAAKALFLAVIFFVVLLFSPTRASASIVLIDKNGNVILKVLSSENSISLDVPKKEGIEIKEPTTSYSAESKVYLSKEEDRLVLNIENQGGQKSLDVSDYKNKEDLIEIEERPEVQTLKIGVVGGKFAIIQKGIVALTDFPINVDAKNAHLSVITPSGVKYLSIFPEQAIQSVLRSKTMNRINPEDMLSITEADGGILSYEIKGDKVINVFNLFEYSTPVVGRVSASTGEILFIEEPTWLRVLGFLFS